MHLSKSTISIEKQHILSVSGTDSVPLEPMGQESSASGLDKIFKHG